MKFEELAKTAAKQISDNAPAILTGLAVAGAVTTTLLSLRAGARATRILSNERSTRSAGEGDLTGKEIFELTWVEFVPPTIMLASTLSCVIGAHSINAKRQTALIGAVTLADTALKDYREKAIELLGPKKEKTIDDKVAEKKVSEDPVSQAQVIITGNGEHMCYDAEYGRYFKSDINSIQRGVNELNAEMLSYGYASLNDFYRKLGLSPIATGEELGWRADNLLEIRTSSHLTDTQVPCLAIQYNHVPIRGYYSGH